MPEWKWTQLISWHMSSFVPSDVCSAHLLVSVLLWILRFSHDWPVVSYLLQPDVLRLPTTHNWHTGQRRVSRDSPTTTSALCERPELRGPVYMLRSLVITDVFNEAAACLVSFLYGNIQSISLTRFCFVSLVFCLVLLIDFFRTFRPQRVNFISRCFFLPMNSMRCGWKLQRKSSVRILS